jgi:hypothetical protein
MNTEREPRELSAVRQNLKSGEYDGVDIMRAWLAIDKLMELQKRIEELEEYKFMFDNLVTSAELLGYKLTNKRDNWFNKLTQIIMIHPKAGNVQAPKEGLAEYWQNAFLTAWGFYCEILDTHNIKISKTDIKRLSEMIAAAPTDSEGN